MVTPPAGAVGRGDGFILRIAEKSGALVLSNDSFQEFHAERPWLFEPGPPHRRQAGARGRLGLHPPHAGPGTPEPIGDGPVQARGQGRRRGHRRRSSRRLQRTRWRSRAGADRGAPPPASTKAAAPTRDRRRRRHRLGHGRRRRRLRGGRRPEAPARSPRPTKKAAEGGDHQATKAGQGHQDDQGRQGGQGGQGAPRRRPAKATKATKAAKADQGHQGRRRPARPPKATKVDEGDEEPPRRRRPPRPRRPPRRPRRRRCTQAVTGDAAGRPTAPGRHRGRGAQRPDDLHHLRRRAPGRLARSRAWWPRSPRTAPTSTWAACSATSRCAAWATRRRPRRGRCSPRGRPARSSWSRSTPPAAGPS